MVFLVRLACLLVAQICYVAAFWPFRARSMLNGPSLAGAYLVAVAALIVVVAAHAGTLAIPVLAYGVGPALAPQT